MILYFGGIRQVSNFEFLGNFELSTMQTSFRKYANRKDK